MEAISIAHKIVDLIDNLRQLSSELEPLVYDMANATGEYDKALAVKIIELKAKGTATTICEKLARGECYKDLVKKELAIALYKIKIKKIDCAQSSLNGYQSVNKHLDKL